MIFKDGIKSPKISANNIPELVEDIRKKLQHLPLLMLKA